MTRVAVLKGGRSLERQVSLKSGARVEDALERLGHEVIPIDVGADLVDRLTAERPEVAFVALHGRDGEDGTVQELLEVMGIPYTGSGVSACIRAADKVLAKHAMRDRGIPTPDFYAFSETWRSSERPPFSTATLVIRRACAAAAAPWRARHRVTGPRSQAARAVRARRLRPAAPRRRSR